MSVRLERLRRLAAGEPKDDGGRALAGRLEDEDDSGADIPLGHLLHDLGVELARDPPDAAGRAVRQRERDQLTLLRLDCRGGACGQRPYGR